MFRNFFKKTQAYGIVPVIKLDSPDQALELAKALVDGGLPVAEVTFRTAAAQESIRRIAEVFPDLLLGAGTVLTVEQAKKAVAAGASFIVSPGFNDAVVNYCVQEKIPVLPGCSSPSDIERALSYGLKTVKFFPAEASGGLKAIKALSAPYGDVLFIPTGGINENNLLEYLSFDKILACGGSWMVPEQLIQTGRFHDIARLTRSAVQLTLGLRLDHLGINGNSKDEAESIAKLMTSLFGLEARETRSGYMLDHAVEILNQPGRGEKGHLAIATHSLTRAMRFFKAQGWAFDASSMKYSPAGQPVAIYFVEEIAGFAIHLLEK